MVIIANSPGRLCNRLFLFGHFIANAVEHKYDLINLDFNEYCCCFPATRLNTFESYKVSVQRSPFGLRRAAFFAGRLIGRTLPVSPLHEIMQVDDDEFFDLGSPSFVNKAKRKLCVVTKGYEMRDHAMFVKHSELLRRIFTPNADTCSAVINRMNTLRTTSGTIVVGVHIRRGDYANYNRGKYFYSTEIYRRKMQELTASLGRDEEKAIRFLICSDERIDLIDFGGMDVTVSASSPVVDLYSLAKCDLIIGPPSSFSMWASFYGKVPVAHINDPLKPLRHEMFSTVTS